MDDGTQGDECWMTIWFGLTSRKEVPRDRAYVFRVRTTPDDEIHRLVRFASREKGALHYGILYPRDEYGYAMRDRFWTAVEAEGGTVVASSGYEPGVTDFAKPIRRMIGYDLLTPAEKKTLARREEVLRRGRRLDPGDAAIARRVAYAIHGPEGEALPPIVDFDALFIPDSQDNVVLIAPQLTFHEVNDVQLLGPGEWNHPDLVAIGRKHVRGAVISALFHAESRFPFVADFVRDYEAIYQGKPDVYSAHSYDATRILMVQLAAGEVTRDGVRDGILLTQGFPGASGVISVGADGNARKRPFLLQVQGGRIISLD
jgi:branched-chain amino acid transport system substrate-binding protein